MLFRIEKIITKTIKIAFIYKMKVAKKQLEKGITWKFNRIALFNFNAVLTWVELLLSISIEWCNVHQNAGLKVQSWIIN